MLFPLAAQGLTVTILARHPRVLMFLPQFYPRVGGAERQADLLASHLVARGVEVEFLIAPQHDFDWPLDDRSPSGIPVHRVPFVDLNARIPRVRNLGLGLLTLLIAAWRTVVAVRRLSARFDVFHAHNAQSPVTAWALRGARRKGLRTVLSVVNSNEWFDLTLLARMSSVWRPWVRWVVHDTDHWIAKSIAIATDLQAFGVPEDRITHLPNGVSVHTDVADIPLLPKHLLHLGRLATTAPRDVEGLVHVFERLALSRKGLKLAIVGGGDRLPHIQAIAAASPAREQLSVTGHQDPSPWLRWAHCMVQPSFAEGFSNALLEGMAAGLACVAYDIPPNREALGDGEAGLLVPVSDHRALGAALDAVTSVDGFGRRLGQNARNRAEMRYDIDAIAARMLELYEMLMRGTRIFNDSCEPAT